MTKPASSNEQPQIPDDTLPRCCESHPDWPTLSQHLADAFPGTPLRDLVRELRRAKQAVEQVGLGDTEALATAELIARHQLMLRAARLS